MPSAVNRTWHLAHRMPQNATLDQRVEWHLGHAENCSCREMPASIRQELERRNIPLPIFKKSGGA